MQKIFFYFEGRFPKLKKKLTHSPKDPRIARNVPVTSVLIGKFFLQFQLNYSLYKAISIFR